MNLKTKIFEKLKYQKSHESEKENDESEIQNMFLFYSVSTASPSFDCIPYYIFLTQFTYERGK